MQLIPLIYTQIYFRLKTEILIDMLAQKTAEVDALLRDNENLRAFIQDNMKQPITRENEI